MIKYLTIDGNVVYLSAYILHPLLRFIRTTHAGEVTKCSYALFAVDFLGAIKYNKFVFGFSDKLNTNH